MIREPSSSDEYELCDWAELQSIVVGRGTTTAGDLIKVIQPDDSRVDNPGADEDESAEDEMLADSVLGLALKRSQLLGSAYPFDVDGKRIRVNLGRIQQSGSAYLLHLLLAAADQSVISADARHAFESECLAVLQDYYRGEAYHFGWTKVNAAAGKIQKRVEEFCSTTTLGWKARQPVNVSQDNNEVGVDLLLWRPMKDRRSNTLLLVGQCASGHNWRGKLATSATKLLEDCLQDTRDGPWINCFCTPFHIPDRIWRETARTHDGLVFDRLRLVLATCEGKPALRGKLRESASVAVVRDVLHEIGANLRLSVAKPKKKRASSKGATRPRGASGTSLGRASIPRRQESKSLRRGR